MVHLSCSISDSALTLALPLMLRLPWPLEGLSLVASRALALDWLVEQPRIVPPVLSPVLHTWLMCKVAVSIAVDPRRRLVCRRVAFVGVGVGAATGGLPPK